MKLHHIAITVKDAKISKEFYKRFFGFNEINHFRRDDMQATGYFLQGDNIIIELWQFDQFKNGTKEDLEFTGIRHIAFHHEDPESFRNELNDKGTECGSINIGASGGKYFFLEDPDGNQIEIYKPAN